MEWNYTTWEDPQDTPLHALFEAQVERMPNAVAVVCDGEQLTYSALNQRANQLAHYLRSLGIGPEVCVGLCVERSLEMVVGLLGILKAGGAYVPLDPTYPTERLATMLADAHSSGAGDAAAMPGCAACAGEYLWSAWIRTGSKLRSRAPANPDSGAIPENLAYVMYTSGSTGTPKGVMVEHRQVLAFLHGFEHVAPGGQGGVGTAVCPFGFDVSVWECFSMLCFGGMLHIVPLDIVTAPEQFVHYLSGPSYYQCLYPPWPLRGGC